MVRSAAQALHEAVSPLQSIPDFHWELINYLHIPTTKVLEWQAALRIAVGSVEILTCGDLMQIKPEHMEQAIQASQLSASEVSTIKMCLGTACTPFEWRSLSEENSAKTNETSALPDPPKSRKGGGMTEAAEVLATRRPTLVAQNYFPPTQFDMHRLGCGTRNEQTLRRLIVQEVRVLKNCSLRGNNTPGTPGTSNFR